MFKKIILAALILITAYALFWPKGSVAVNNPAPNIIHKTIDGEDFNLESLRGKYVLIDFWASWCPPCLRDAPNMVNLNNTLQGKNFEIVSIALERKSGASLKTAQRFGFNWTYQLEDPASIVRLSTIGRLYNVTEIPTKILVDPKGNIVKIDPTMEEVIGLVK